MVAAIAPAGAALAHNGTGGAASDYRIEITGYTGDPRGIDLHVVELGNRIELRRTSAHVCGCVRLRGRAVFASRLDPAWQRT